MTAREAALGSKGQPAFAGDSKKRLPHFTFETAFVFGFSALILPF
jgi:hypothetical protein